jgi:hypothetical protein
MPKAASVRPLFSLLIVAAFAATAACSAETSDKAVTDRDDLTADPVGAIKLTSSDGHQITVSGEPSEGGEPEFSVTHSSENVQIRVTGPAGAKAIRAVVINDCSEFGHPLFQAVETCDLKDGGESFSAPLSACQQTQKPDNQDDYFPGILLDERTEPGDDIRCTQEIAVVVDGTWLTDPVNGSHNFKFTLPSALPKN